MFMTNGVILLLVSILAASNAMTVSYGFNGIDSEQFASIFHKFPLPILLKVLESMENQTQIILRPFNFGATKSYAEHTGLGKNTNVKGKSCYLDDETLNGKITYIQSNAYTGRTQPDAKINYIGKYVDRDRLAISAFSSAATQHCTEWKNKSIEDIKNDLIAKLKEINDDNLNLDSTVDYISQRYMFKVDIQGTHYLTTEFVTTATVESNTQLPITTEHCEDGHCHYEVSDETTKNVDVLAYQTLNFDTCEFKAFQLVADMDILTIHFPHEDKDTEVDFKKYFNDPTGKNCEDSFKLAFGISPKESMIYNYVYKLMEATAEWGLIRHSIEALNFCFTQPYEQGEKYYLKLSKDIIGNGEVTMIKEAQNSRIIPDTVRIWVLEGKCTPLNPSWLFFNEKEPKALMWSGEELDSILKSPEFLNNKCPTYDVIRMIQADGASIPMASIKSKNLRTDKHHQLFRHRKN